MQHLVFPHVLRIDKRGRTLTASIRSKARVLGINVALQQATTSEPLATVRAGVTPLPPVGGANMSAKVLALGIGPRKIFIYTGSTQAIHFYYNKYFLHPVSALARASGYENILIKGCLCNLTNN